MDWTAIRTPEEAQQLFPNWFSARMIGERGSFGLLLATGDVMRITSVTAIQHAGDGTIMIDVLLDSAGPPQGVDHAWEIKHYLGAPVPGATLATVNAAHVVAAVEFVAAEIAEPSSDNALPASLGAELVSVGDEPELVKIAVA